MSAHALVARATPDIFAPNYFGIAATPCVRACVWNPENLEGGARAASRSCPIPEADIDVSFKGCGCQHATGFNNPASVIQCIVKNCSPRDKDITVTGYDAAVKKIITDASQGTNVTIGSVSANSTKSTLQMPTAAPSTGAAPRINNLGGYMLAIFALTGLFAGL